MKKALILIILGCWSLTLSAQSVSTQGKEFWLSFMQNGYYENNSGSIPDGVIPQLTVSAKRQCSVSVTNPSFPEWSMNFQVEANGIQQQNLPKQYSYHMGSDNETLSNKGIHIVATDTISVYCANIANYSFDASFVLPIDGLGDDYIIQCGEQSTLTNVDQYKRNNQTSAFLIVATEDNTTVNIIPTVSTVGDHLAGVTFPITLNAGQTYQVRSNNTATTSAGRDLSGTRVTANDCKKIAVFNGNTLTRLPIDMSGSSGFDHIFEQAMPIRSWGKKFVVTQSMTRNRDFVKVVSAVDGNEIKKNGEVIATLNANEVYSFALSSYEGSCYLEASHTCAVYLYNTSAGDGKANGDPSMVWIAPIEQRIDQVTFATFTHYQASIDYHYVNIIVSSGDKDKVFLDGLNIPADDFNPVNGNNEFSYTRKSISHGTHHLSCANGFNAHVYGFGDAKGYAYLVGSNAIDLSTNLIINDMVVHNNDVFQYCIEEEVVFSAEVNFQDYDLVWDFGDGETSTDNPAYHTYHVKDIHHASLIVTTDESGCEASASDTTLFDVDVTQQFIIEEDETCVGANYSAYGFNNVLILNDTILGRAQPNPDNPRCTDSVLVFITAWPTFITPISDSRCWTGEPGVYNEHGFDFIYDRPDSTYVMQRELDSSHGCDSIVILTLEVGDFEIHDTESHYLCYEDTPSFFWAVNNQTYHEDGFYADTLPSGDCYAIYSLDLHFMHTPDTISTSATRCESFSWDITGETYDHSGQYYYNEPLSPFDCDQVYHLDLTISGTTILEPLIFLNKCDSVSFFIYDEEFVLRKDCDSLFIGETPEGCDYECPVKVQDMHYSSAPSSIRIPDDPYHYHDGDTIPVITNTEFFSFYYDFYVEDTLGHIDNWDSCVWRITKESWQIAPSPEEAQVKPYCRVYVADHDDNPVELSCTIYNSHCEPHSLTKKFYLKSSFFGIDEPQTERPDFSVVPNPNNGQMELRFEHLTGKIEVKVYDMRGSLIDQFETFNDLENKTLQYDFKPFISGIYFFVATGKEGSVARKVVVTP